MWKMNKDYILRNCRIFHAYQSVKKKLITGETPYAYFVLLLMTCLVL